MLSKTSKRLLVGYVQNIARFSSVAESFEKIPAPKGLPLVGTTLALIAAGGPAKLHKYMDMRHKELGPIFREQVGHVTAVFLSDPDEMRNVFAKEGKYPEHIKPESWLIYNKKHNYSRGLFFMDGQEWHYYRKTMNKLLLKGNLAWIDDCCDVATDVLLNRIKDQENREFHNIEQQLYRWSLDMILSVLVGAKMFNNCSYEVNDLVEKLASTVHLVFANTCNLQLLPAKLAEKYNLKRWRNFEESVKESLDLANQLLDLINLKYKNPDGLLYKMTEENLDKEAISRIVVDLILSAGDTTAYTMAWVLYLISQHKDIQLELRDSLRKDLKTSYLRNTIKETLRLFPVAPFLTRFAQENLTVCGYKIPPQTLIVMSIYTSGRCSKYFKNSENFNPNRWLRSTGNSPLQQASMPFGIGARSCIGRKIAETQLQMTLSKIVRTFDVNILNGNEIEDILTMVSKPSKPLRLIFTKI